MKKLAENLWVLPYPLRLLGANFGRMVTIVHLRSGELVIHSTGPFTPADVTSILGLGQPGWLLEVIFSTTLSLSRGGGRFPKSLF